MIAATPFSNNSNNDCESSNDNCSPTSNSSIHNNAEPSNYFTQHRLGYRTDSEIASLPTAVDTAPRRKAYHHLGLAFGTIVLLLVVDAFSSMTGWWTVVSSIVRTVVYVALIFVAWQCFEQEHQLTQAITTLEQQQQSFFFPAHQEPTYYRSARLVLWRGLPILLFLVVWWIRAAVLVNSSSSIGWVFLVIVLIGVALLYGAEFIYLEWCRKQAVQDTHHMIEPTTGGNDASTTAVSPAPLLLDAQIA